MRPRREHPNCEWFADTSEFPTAERKLNVATVLDPCWPLMLGLASPKGPDRDAPMRSRSPAPSLLSEPPAAPVEEGYLLGPRSSRRRWGMGALSQRFALVTGGSRGIGRGIVQRLASDGAVVAFSYVKDGSAAEEVERVVARAGGNARGFAADLSQMSEVRTLFNDAEEWLGRLDIVVLNAGVAVGGPIAEVTEEMYDRVMDVNAKATFFGIQEAGRRLRDGGRIITMSSSNTVLVEPGASVYSASKAAIEQVSGIAARELGARAITVNIVSPRATNTDGLVRGCRTGAQRRWPRSRHWDPSGARRMSRTSWRFSSAPRVAGSPDKTFVPVVGSLEAAVPWPHGSCRRGSSR